jgi:hypothetical protein
LITTLLNERSDAILSRILDGRYWKGVEFEEGKEDEIDGGQLTYHRGSV